MCRLFGLHAGRFVATATFWLLDAPDSLAAQSKRNPDGTGVGVFDGDGIPVLRKQPIAAWDDAEFACEAHQLSGTTFIAHVRYVSTGKVDVLNTLRSCRTVGCSRTTVSSVASMCSTRGWSSCRSPIWSWARRTANGSSR